MEADDYLMMSGIQHYCFCRRQWALIHIEQQWKENWRTIAGNIIHERVHDSDIRESRGDMFVMRGLQVSSSILQLSGICDSVEFVYDIDGISIAGHVGCWRIIPVEYKRGRERKDDADRIQLCAQCIALEEMFSCSINYGFIYHSETHRRERVIFSESLRICTKKIAQEMNGIYYLGITPPAEFKPHCRSCSLNSICMPKMKKSSDYVMEKLKEVN